MKIIDTVIQFVKDNSLYCVATTCMILGATTVPESGYWAIPSTIVYLVGVIFLMAPLHYGAYRVLYNIYSILPTWLQPKPPAIPNNLRRTFDPVPSSWTTVTIHGHDYLQSYSVSDWCTDHTIGRYGISDQLSNKGMTLSDDNGPRFTLKVHFKDERDALMFKMSNA